MSWATVMRSPSGKLVVTKSRSPLLARSITASASGTVNCSSGSLRSGCRRRATTSIVSSPSFSTPSRLDMRSGFAVEASAITSSQASA